MRTDPNPLGTSKWRAIRIAVAERAHFRCEHCEKFLGMSGQGDHIVPRSVCERLGISVFDDSNVQYLCGPCHSKKTNSERWAGHQCKDRNAVRRKSVRGREAFFNALSAVKADPMQSIARDEEKTC